MSATSASVPVERLGEPKKRIAEQIWRAGNSDPAVLVLRPLSALFGLAVRTRRLAYERGWLHARRAAIPVISVGNLTVGGAGKTPFTRWLVDGLLQRGQRPAILHGGYSADEPALHRAWHPQTSVFAGRDRVLSAREAVARGASVIVLDDGLQHLRLARDLDIVLLPADAAEQPQRLLPAGAWREPLATARSADVVVITRKAASANSARAMLGRLPTSIGTQVRAQAALVITGFVKLGTGEPLAPPSQATVVCGIADPQALALQLETAGMRLDRLLVFDDHHEYTAADVRAIKQRSGNGALVTTEKDAVKLARLDSALNCWVTQQRVVIESGAAELWAAVERVLK